MIREKVLTFRNKILENAPFVFEAIKKELDIDLQNAL
jgi:hypothetical protein